jgi:hypothetical protein
VGSSSVYYVTEQSKSLSCLYRVNYGLDCNKSYRHFMGEQSIMGNILGAHTLHTSLQRSGPHTVSAVCAVETGDTQGPAGRVRRPRTHLLPL